jgi:hypothetical protein
MIENPFEKMHLCVGQSRQFHEGGIRMPHKRELPTHLLSVVDSRADRGRYGDAINRDLMIVRLTVAGGEWGEGA